jgi:hypothetical protein
VPATAKRCDISFLRVNSFTVVCSRSTEPLANKQVNDASIFRYVTAALRAFGSASCRFSRENVIPSKEPSENAGEAPLLVGLALVLTAQRVRLITDSTTVKLKRGVISILRECDGVIQRFAREPCSVATWCPSVRI